MATILVKGKSGPEQSQKTRSHYSLINPAWCSLYRYPLHDHLQPFAESSYKKPRVHGASNYLGGSYAWVYGCMRTHGWPSLFGPRMTDSVTSIQLARSQI